MVSPADAETINGIRAGLMGPLAGLGDSNCWYLYYPTRHCLGLCLRRQSMIAWNVPSCTLV